MIYWNSKIIFGNYVHASVMARWVLYVAMAVVVLTRSECLKRREDKTKCPHVKAIKNFDLNEFMGLWYVVQYYASSEEALAYRCMRTRFREEEVGTKGFGISVTMNFTYSFIDDPINEQLLGNITWQVPDPVTPAHWVHAEDTYEGIYNTYILDTDYTSWALLLHCAEKDKIPRYLSAFIMSRSLELGPNVISYLRDKLPKYDIDLNYVFEMKHFDCDSPPISGDVPVLISLAAATRSKNAQHPMKRIDNEYKFEFD